MKDRLQYAQYEIDDIGQVELLGGLDRAAVIDYSSILLIDVSLFWGPEKYLSKVKYLCFRQRAKYDFYHTAFLILEKSKSFCLTSVSWFYL